MTRSIKRPQRVFMILDSVYPSTGGGGAESQVGTLTRWLAGQGIPSTIVVPMVPWGPQAAYEQHGLVDIIRLRYPRLPMLGGLVLLARLAWLLHRRRNEIKAIHCHIAKNMAVLSAILNRLLKKPLIVKLTGMTELHGGILDHHPSIFMRIKRAILRKTMIQAISQALGNRLTDVGFSPAQVYRIPNAVDLDRFDPQQPAMRELREQARQDDHLVVLYVGRLEAVKGLDILLDAWMDAFTSEQKVRLLLVGTGSLESELKKKVHDLRRSAQVLFLGQSDDVSEQLAIADLGVLASYTEGLSNTLLESMAAGLPMIGSRVSGNEDFIQPGVTGWLFPPGSKQALAECLRAAYRLGRPGLNDMGRAARRFVGANASIPVVGHQLRTVYDGDAWTLTALGDLTSPDTQPTDTMH
ncbi:MAG: glycosyltransferase family 4 protein [Lautropia sp.]|nr:glycosyltransferase family 4 protein [Lautropia sp.]